MEVRGEGGRGERWEGEGGGGGYAILMRDWGLA